MNGDLLDIVLVLLAVAFGVSGYRQGFIIGALSFAGFITGGVLGAIYAPEIVHWIVGGGGRPAALVALIFVFTAAVFGQFLTSSLGVIVRNQVTWSPARFLDALGGAVASIVSLLLIAWLLGSALATSPFPTLAKQVRGSQVLHSVDGVMPDVAHTWFSAFRRIVDQQAFPKVFGGINGGSIASVPPPDEDVLQTRALRAASRSVVKVVGTAPACDRRTEGSGFVYAPRHVLTNAHVVAGVRDGANIVTRGGQSYDGQIVEYNPRRDVAVLYVPALPLPDLNFAGQADTGDSAVVAGYPHGQGLSAAPARVREYQQARGPGIYQTHQVTRQIYTLRGQVEPGNSGGPLLSPRGRVYGVVFAASVENPHTGYALTSREVYPDARRAATATDPVSTMTCR